MYVGLRLAIYVCLSGLLFGGLLYLSFLSVFSKLVCYAHVFCICRAVCVCVRGSKVGRERGR